MSTYRIIPASPDIPPIVGRVHGNGGMLSGQDGLGKLRFFASSGKFGGFQPMPGHVRVYPEWSPAEDGPAVDVPITNAAIQLEPECTCDPADGFGLLGGGWDPSCEKHGKHLEER